MLMFLTSCSCFYEEFSVLQLFILLGFVVVGSFLGYLVAICPRINITTGSQYLCRRKTKFFVLKGALIALIIALIMISF